MKLAKHDLIAALRLRYDHYSATSVFENALAKAGLPDQAEYEAPQVEQFRAALRRVADRLTNVEARIDSLLEAAPQAKSEPPKAETKPEPKPEPKTEKKAEAKSDAKVVETTIALAGVQAA